MPRILNIYLRVIKSKIELLCVQNEHLETKKTVASGVMESPNKPGRPRRQWLDDVNEWFGSH